MKNGLEKTETQKTKKDGKVAFFFRLNIHL